MMSLRDRVQGNDDTCESECDRSSSATEVAQPLTPRLGHFSAPAHDASMFARSGFWILLAINLMVGVVNWAVYGWMPTFLKDHFKLGLGAAGLSATAYIQIASLAGVLSNAVEPGWVPTRMGGPGAPET